MSDNLKDRIVRMRAWQVFEADDFRASDLEAVLSAAETLANQGKPQITEHTERAVLTVDRIAQSTGMTRTEVVATINAIGNPQITEQMVQDGAYRYWLESERDAEGDYPNREWEPDEREQFVWATRIVLEAALGKGGE